MMVLFLALWLSFPSLAETNPAPLLPPKTMLHVGQKAHMLENGRQGTIPEETWNRYIMGRETRFGLVPWRRGLYGGENLDSLELYATAYLGSRNGTPKTPWLMRITIKDECRKPEAVTDLANDEKFLGWLFENTHRLVKNYSYCLNLKTQDCGELIVGTQPVSNGREENLCDDLMQELILGTKARVVRDTEWFASWYLRDRSCIEKLEAGPDVVLQALAEAGWDHASRNRSFSPTTPYGLGNFAILMGALADSNGADPKTLDLLHSKLRSSDIKTSHGDQSLLWIREAGPAAVEAYRRCEKAGNLENFRSYQEALMKELHKPDALKFDGPLFATLSALSGELKQICH